MGPVFQIRQQKLSNLDRRAQPRVMNYDVVIIGGGAAGLSAALVLARARRRVVVVDAGSPRNAPAEHMHGFLSRDGMPPLEFLAAGRAEVEGYGVTIVHDKVTGIRPGFHVELGSGSLTARRVVVATGLRDTLPDIPGAREQWGKDVVACPYCHGYEVRDQPLAVIGSAEHAVLVRQWSSDVVFFPHTTPVTDRARLNARDIRVVDGTIARLVVADSKVRGVELTDGRFVPRSAVFIGSEMTPNDDVLTRLGCQVGANGFVVTDPTGQTSVPGVWAVGNVANPHLHVITAAATGANAAVVINMDLLTDVFSPEMEREVSEAVTGSRRHGLRATSA
jgi:thioredoxin reductase